ncbi:hypothetical protein V5279_05665 [Bradyrhizobium sp. 26S5]|uniref:hypothetical protein n=1 Tax=Bradyrhizobium sp. 26S5 TaxID=3139729 RepID=UPI0030CBB920
MEPATLPATAFKSPAISLSGVVDYNMYTAFRTQFDNAADKDCHSACNIDPLSRGIGVQNWTPMRGQI